MRRFMSATGPERETLQRYERRPGSSTFLQVIDDSRRHKDNAPIRNASFGGTVDHQSLRIRRRHALGGLLTAGLVVTPVALAHHGFGNFAMDEDITLSGEVIKVDFVNPHSWVHFNVTKPDGTKAEYRCELRSATTLRRSGWTPEMFAAGTKITIQGSPDRAEKNACYTSTITFADGTVLDRYGQRIPAQSTTQRPAKLPSGEPNLSGDWAVEQLVMTDPAGRDGTLVPLSRVGSFERGAVPEGQQEIPGARGTPQAAAPRTGPPPAGGGGGGGFAGRPAVALTEAGQKAMQAQPQMSRAERSCAPGSIVSDWGGEPVNRISQSAGTVTIQYGRNGRTRTVHTDMTAHPANVAPSVDGHSIGKWEGDVLVVDTVGFVPGTLLGTTPHSAQLHVVERFSIDPATTTLKREVTAEDPLYYSAKYTRSDTMIVSTVPYAPEPCQDLTPVVPPAPAAAR
jgi:hypothetical protein